MISFDSERCMEDWVCLCLDDGINPITKSSVTSYIRQPSFGCYGIGDILIIDSMRTANDKVIVECTLMELKNQKIHHDHVSQVARYRKYIETHLCDQLMDANLGCVFLFSYMLVGLKTFPTSSDLEFLIESSEWIDVYEIQFGTDCSIQFNLVDGWEKQGDTAASDCILSEIEAWVIEHREIEMAHQSLSDES